MCSILIPQRLVGPLRLVMLRSGEPQQSSRNRRAIDLLLMAPHELPEECALRPCVRYAQIAWVVAGHDVPARVQN